MRRLWAIVLLVGLVALSGCSSTPVWEEHYRGVEPGTHPETASVVVREVPWSRLDEALREIEADRAASDEHPDEWPRERLLAERAQLLTALQISEPAERVEVLGRSVFRSTRPVDPEDGSLEKFARSIGADYAVWAAHYEGTRQVRRTEPVQHHGFSTGVSFGSRRGTMVSPWYGTTFVPVTVEEDEHAWLVYYLKVR